ncbi:MAG: iron chelate uptake ABC transporter family permease subunit [Solirubrobacteraceae bacterium]|nr:iron chelate uptake ABC transporter family permease subunit [Solirubrobacteraceae bacterium]
MSAPVPAVRAPAVRSPGGRLSLRVHRRGALVCAALAAAAVAAALAGLALGDYPLSPGEVVAALAGRGDGPADVIVTELRLPRVVCALAVGAALGVAGAIFQRLTRNPLGSPDVIGVTYGSAAGAVAMIVAVGARQSAVSAGALGAGLATAAAVHLLARRDGAVQGYRLVLVGIGVSAMLLAVIDSLLARGRIEEAREAAVWIAGSLDGRGWAQATPLVAALAVLLPAALALSPRLAVLELGDDAAAALGVAVERTRLALIVVAVAIAAAATAAAGPIAFVALAAPQIARRLTRTPGPGLVGAALTGALLLQAGDLAAQRLLAPDQLPVGIATGALGGVYLAWLLASERRGRRRA